MDDKMKYGIAGLLIGGFSVWLISMSIINTSNTRMMGMMGFSGRAEKSVAQNTNLIDAHFIEQMIPHHEDAIIMAKLAQTKAQKEEIKQLAESIIISQSREIEQMRQWYKEWFGKEVPQGNQVMSGHGMMQGSNMHMGMMGDESDMARLENAQDFDKAFIEEMIPHHQMAVMMASMLKGGTQRPEMKKLAGDIITAQTKEIEQMRIWLQDWR